jgi:HK97 gp10 family phage protein
MPSPTVTVQLTGLKELEEELIALGKDVGTKVLVAGTRDMANIIRDSAKAKAPIGNVFIAGKKSSGKDWIKRNPGTLRKSIRVRRERDPGDASVKMQVYIGNRAYYGTWVEFGRTGMAAKPFLRPALDQDGERALQSFAQLLKKRIYNPKTRLRRGRK